LAADFWIAALSPLANAFAIAAFWSAKARKEEAQNIAAAERTRGARDILRSYDLSKARTRITLPLPTLMVNKRFPLSDRAATRERHFCRVHRLADVSRVSVGIAHGLAS
jgi:hypothetical protein